MTTNKKQTEPKAAKPTKPVLTDGATAHAVFRGPQAEIEVEGIGVIFLGQGVPDIHPAYAEVASRPDFEVIPV